MVPHALTGRGGRVEAVCEILQRHCGCSRQAGRGASGVSWLMDQCSWMVRGEDHLAWGFRHSSGEIGADGVWASFSTLATEEAGIRRPYHPAINLNTSRAHRPDPNPNAGRGKQAPRVP
jgi:hypothetical protein